MSSGMKTFLTILGIIIGLNIVSTLLSGDIAFTSWIIDHKLLLACIIGAIFCFRAASKAK